MKSIISNTKSTKPYYLLALMIIFLVIDMATATAQQNTRVNGQQAGQDTPPRGGQQGDGNRNQPPRNQVQQQLTNTDVEQQLRSIISQFNITPADISDLPSINSPKAQLGKQLFFAKHLGGESSVACVSCHHPVLGGGDNLSLSIGVSPVDRANRINHALLGLGRFNGIDSANVPVVPRNAPTIFNLGLMNRTLFADGRVQVLENGQIATPDSTSNNQGELLPDTSLPEGATLAAAQAKFPVTSAEEMRGSFMSEADNAQLRNALSARFANSLVSYNSTWPVEFAKVFADGLVTPERIFDAIGEYERSMTFVNNGWFRFVAGNNNAMTDEQKHGALLFFTPLEQGGAGCAACHNGPNFSDQRHHLVAFPQIGVGKGNASLTATSQDFGRENVTNHIADRFHFRTPSLLNIAQTAPYGHTGAYQTLTDVVNHYVNPSNAINRLFGARNGQAFVDGNARFCQLPQIRQLMQKNNQTCQQIFPDAFQNSTQVIAHWQQSLTGNTLASSPLSARARLNRTEVQQVVAFMHALTDPCTQNRQCLAPWIIDDNDVASYPDAQPLIAVDQHDNAL